MRVLSTACGLGIEGSGWAVAPGLIVTNAHVVAGADDTTVTTQGGSSSKRRRSTTRPRDDLALLRVGADIPTLPISSRRPVGADAAVLGYPENGPYSLAPARLGETRETISEDSYGRGPVDRTITALGGSVRSGNSGGPLVDARGRVIGIVFAATTSGSPGGFAIPAELVREALAPHRRHRSAPGPARADRGLADHLRSVSSLRGTGHADPGSTPAPQGGVCPHFHAAIELIGKRWTGAIVCALTERPMRFGELRKAVPGLSDRLLSQRLRELEEEGLVEREVEAGTPVRVTYSLTEVGRELDPAIHELRIWAQRWRAAG